MQNLSWRLVGVLSAASLPATVAGIMIFLDRVNWPALAMVFILSLPLYVAARGPARLPDGARELPVRRSRV